MQKQGCFVSSRTGEDFSGSHAVNSRDAYLQMVTATIVLSVALLAVGADRVQQTAPAGNLREYMADVEALRASRRSVAASALDRAVIETDVEISDAISHSWTRTARRSARQIIQYRDRQPLRAAQGLVQLEAQDRAVSIYDGRKLELSHSFHYAVALVELRRYSDARRVLSAIESDQKSDWTRHIQSGIDALDLMEDGQTPTLEFLRLWYRQALPRWYRHRVTPLLVTWQTEVEADEVIKKGRLLARFFADADDWYGQSVALLWLAQHEDVPDEAAAQALFDAGEVYGRNDRASGAIRVWRDVEQQYPKTVAAARAIFRIGLTQQQRDEHEKAMHEFRRLLPPEAGGPEIRDPAVPPELPPDAQYGSALWQIAHSYRALADYAAALDTYRLAVEEYPLRHAFFCGLGPIQYHYRYQLYQGLCLEHLGRTNEAVERYWHAVKSPECIGGGVAAHLRLFEIYDATGNLPALERLARDLPSGTNSELFEALLRYDQYAKQGEWSALIDVLIERGHRGTRPGPMNPLYKDHDWRAIAAGRLLATQPQETVPVLLQKIEALDARGRPEWVWYALGRCGTPEAIAALRQVARNQTNAWRIRSVRYALWVAGERGQEVIESIWGPEAREAVQSQYEPYIDPVFPTPPPMLKFE